MDRPTPGGPPLVRKLEILQSLGGLYDGLRSPWENVRCLVKLQCPVKNLIV